MKLKSKILAACCAVLFVGSGLLRAQVLLPYAPPIDSYDHVDANGVNDPGVTTTNADGSTTTTYIDGCTKTTSADSSFGAGGQKDVVKDHLGRLIEIIKRDPKGKKRRHTEVIYNYPKVGTRTIYYESYDADGKLIGATEEEKTGKVERKAEWDKETKAWDQWVVENAAVEPEKME